MKGNLQRKLTQFHEWLERGNSLVSGLKDWQMFLTSLKMDSTRHICNAVQRYKSIISKAVNIAWGIWLGTFTCLLTTSSIFIITFSTAHRHSNTKDQTPAPFPRIVVSPYVLASLRDLRAHKRQSVSAELHKLLPREVVYAPSLEMIKPGLDEALTKLIEWVASLPMGGDLEPDDF